MATGRTSRNANRKRNREKHKLLGLCEDCCNTPKDGMIRCEKCLKRRNEAVNRFKMKQGSHNLKKESQDGN
jgi:hypothetical protein